MNKIIVYCEMNLKNYMLDEVSYELSSKAVELKEQAKNFQVKNNEYVVEAVILGGDLDKTSLKRLLDTGVDSVVLIKEKTLEHFSQTVFAQCFVEYYQTSPSDIVIFPATSYGRMVAPRITTALDTGLVADCTGLEFVVKNDDLKLAPTRPTFGSELMATILSKKNPQCATIRPKTFKPDFSKNIDGKYTEFYPNSYEEPRIKLLRTMLNKKDKTIDFANAKIVLAAGYGLSDGKDRKYYTRLERIAKIINAKVASTRKVADFELLPRDTQIGQTGSYVEADLYVAFGISGAIQHVSGMKNSKTIIAINSDSNADIFKYADYKIVADAKTIVDEMLEMLS